MSSNWQRPRDANGRWTSTNSGGTATRTPRKRSPKKKKAQAASIPIPATPSTPSLGDITLKTQKTYVGILLDGSGSMSLFENNGQVVQLANTMLDAGRAEVQGQEISARVTFFDDNKRDGSGNPVTLIREADLQSFKPLEKREYVTYGGTPLRESIIRELTNFQAKSDARDPDVSFLLYVLTDGEENSSRSIYSNFLLADTINSLQKTGRWTVVAYVPPGKKERTVKYTGLPEGNVKEWEATVRGMDDVIRTSGTTTQSYFSARKKGLRATDKFFAEVKDEKQISKALSNVTNDYNAWTINETVGKEFGGVPFTSSVQSWVEVVKSLPFDIGRSFYQLTKPEKVQDRKSILLRDKRTGKIFSGPLDDVCEMIGVPAFNGEFTLKPGNQGWFDIFIQSTSSNRILVRGSTLLYKK